MGFTANEAAIGKLGRLVRACGDDLGRLVDGTGMGSGTDGGVFGTALGGMLEQAQGPYNAICDTAKADTTTAARLATDSGVALGEAAKYYAADDDAHAAALDRTVPPGTSPARLDKPPVEGDTGEPFTKYDEDPIETAKKNYERGTDMERPDSDAFKERWGLKVAEEISAATGKASFSSDLRAFLTHIAGSDILGTMVGALGPGGWELLDAQAVAFQQGANALDGIKENLDRGRFDIQGSWAGNAADEAGRWLERFAGCLVQHRDFLRTGAGEIMDFCRTMYLNMEQLNALIDLLIDKLAGLLPIAEAADVGTAILNILKGEDKLHIIASLMVTLADIDDWIWSAHQGVSVFVSMLHRAQVDGPVNAAQWPPEPYVVPELMRK